MNPMILLPLIGVIILLVISGFLIADFFGWMKRVPANLRAGRIWPGTNLLSLTLAVAIFGILYLCGVL